MRGQEGHVPHIDVEQAKVRFAELLELVAAGQEMMIDKDQQPFVKLSPATLPRLRRVFGSARGKIHMAPDFDEPLPGFQDYNQDPCGR